MTMLRISILGVVIMLYAIGAILPSHDIPQLAQQFKPPSSTNWMGTDQLGRDVWIRGVRAITRSVSVAGVAWSIALCLGIMLGAVAAMSGDRVLGRVIETAIAMTYTMPTLLVLIGVMSLFGRGTGTAYVIVIVIAWAPVARHTRAISRQALQARFVISAREMGFGSIALIWSILVPAVYRPVLLGSLAILPELVAVDAALSFFGFGPPPPAPTIGTMIVDGIQHLGGSMWILAWPVVLLAVTCLIIRFIIPAPR